MYFTILSGGGGGCGCGCGPLLVARLPGQCLPFACSCVTQNLKVRVTKHPRACLGCPEALKGYL